MTAIMPPGEVSVDEDFRNNSTHLVRLNVVGLSGIQVDRRNVRSAGLKRAYPRPPSKMRAVVAVSRGHQIKATTPLSQPLCRPPNDFKPEIDPSDGMKRRHLALWGSTRSTALGTLLEFEVTLDRLDVGDGRHSSSQYVPKSFEVIAGLTEGTEHERKVALPIGVANLPITGNNDGEIIAVDLPILSLSQANPVGDDKNGLRGFQMMSIHDKDCSNMSVIKKKNFTRLLGRNQKEHTQRIPSVVERKIFSSVYSTDPSDEAILHVQLQVIEKSNYEDDGVIMLQQTSSQESYQGSYQELSGEIDEATNPESVAVFNDTYDFAEVPSDETLMHKKGFDRTESIATASLTSDSSPSLEMAEHESLMEDIQRSNTDMEEPSIHYSAREADYMADDDRSLSKCSTQEETESPTVFSKSSGVRRSRRQGYFDDFRLPSCGGMVHSDDMTMVSGDFFGREFRFPICTSLRDRLDEEDTFLYEEGETVDQYSLSARGGSVIHEIFSSNPTKDIQERVVQVLARAEKALSRCGDNEGEPHVDRMTMASSLYEEERPRTVHWGEPPSSSVGTSQDSQSASSESKSSDNLRFERIQKAEQKFKEEKKREEEREKMKKSIAAILQCTTGIDETQKEGTMVFVPTAKVIVPNDLLIPEEPNGIGTTGTTYYEFKTQKSTTNRGQHEWGIPLPAAFGGPGMCSRINVADDEDIVDVMTLQATSSSMNARSISQLTEDKYFDDHDGYRTSTRKGSV